MTGPLLEIRDLAVDFLADEGVVQAVRGVSFNVEPGRTVALVGEEIDRQIADLEQRAGHGANSSSAVHSRAPGCAASTPSRRSRNAQPASSMARW